MLVEGNLRIGRVAALLVFFVYALQCLSTVAVLRRETNSWRYPLAMAGYLFGIAWLASFLTYRIAVHFGAGLL